MKKSSSSHFWEIFTRPLEPLNLYMSYILPVIRSDHVLCSVLVFLLVFREVVVVSSCVGC